jgi:predicted DNA-binding mobile mystery protein A
MNKKSLQLQQLGRKMRTFPNEQDSAMPPSGWINAIRTALGMSLQQLGDKMSITKQSVQNIEKREKDGSVTIKSLREVAKAMDMHLVYGFVPVDGNLDALIDRKAKELATQIVMRTSNTMKLEDQENTKKRIEKAIQERTDSIKNEMPKILWD